MLGNGTNPTPTPTPVPDHDHIFRKQECVEVPEVLQVFGLGNICAELDLVGCQKQATARIRMQGASAPLFEYSINPSQHEYCGPRSSMPDSPVLMACGAHMDICVSFLDKTGKNTLNIEESYIHACPTLTIKNCTPPFPRAPTLSDLPLDMGCADIGRDCALFNSCETCTEGGCGWCGQTKKCVSGNQFGPRCGNCGVDGQCDCSWSYGMCPATPKDMGDMEAAIADKEAKLKAVTDSVNEVVKEVQDGKDIPFGNQKFRCETPGEKKSGNAINVTVTVFVTLAVLICTLLFGAYAGKVGWVDVVWERLSAIRLPRRDDETALRPPSPSTYTPPSM